MFRDTGAYQSLVVQIIVDQLPHSDTGESVAIQGVGGTCLTIPLHEVYLKSQFVTGKVMVGIIHQLPFANVDLLLGNDLTDRCCHTGGEIVDVCGWPVGIEQQVDPIIFPACVTTMYMALRDKLADIEPVDLSETFIAHAEEVENRQDNPIERDTPKVVVTKP